MLIFIEIVPFFGLSKVEDVVSRAADGTSTVQDLDFSSLRSQLGPLATVSSCISILYFQGKLRLLSLLL